MVRDRQVKRLWRLAQNLSVEACGGKGGDGLEDGAEIPGDRRLPSEMRQSIRTRPDPPLSAPQSENNTDAAGMTLNFVGQSGLIADPRRCGTSKQS